MKIAIVSEHASPLKHPGGTESGGQSVYVAQLARHLAGRGHEVDIFTRRDSRQVPDLVYWEGCRVIHVAAGPPEFVPTERLLLHMEEFTNAFVRHARRTSRAYDLAHAHFWLSGLVTLEAKRILSLPFVVTFYSLGRVRRRSMGGADGFSDDRFRFEDRIVLEADRLNAECPQDRDDLIELYGAEPARISVVPCGFDPSEFWPVERQVARDRIGVCQGEFVILQLGRMLPRKGVDTVIRGFAQFVRARPYKARLLVVGSEQDDPALDRSPELSRLRELAQTLGLEDRVDFIGRPSRESLRDYYCAANVFVTLPWYEPFGMTPLESMACGTPVIGSRVGGIKYTVMDGKTGLLIEPRDPDALCGALIRLADDPELRECFRRESVRHVHEGFSWCQVVPGVEDAYLSALKQAKARGAPIRRIESGNEGKACRA